MVVRHYGRRGCRPPPEARIEICFAYLLGQALYPTNVYYAISKENRGFPAPRLRQEGVIPSLLQKAVRPQGVPGGLMLDDLRAVVLPAGSFEPVTHLSLHVGE